MKTSQPDLRNPKTVGFIICGLVALFVIASVAPICSAQVDIWGAGFSIQKSCVNLQPANLLNLISPHNQISGESIQPMPLPSMLFIVDTWSYHGTTDGQNVHGSITFNNDNHYSMTANINGKTVQDSGQYILDMNNNKLSMTSSNSGLTIQYNTGYLQPNSLHVSNLNENFVLISTTR